MLKLIQSYFLLLFASFIFTREEVSASLFNNYFICVYVVYFLTAKTQTVLYSKTFLRVAKIVFPLKLILLFLKYS